MRGRLQQSYIWSRSRRNFKTVVSQIFSSKITRSTLHDRWLVFVHNAREAFTHSCASRICSEHLEDTANAILQFAIALTNTRIAWHNCKNNTRYTTNLCEDVFPVNTANRTVGASDVDILGGLLLTWRYRVSYQNIFQTVFFI